MLQKKLLIVIVFALCCHNAASAEIPVQDLYALSLKELLNIEVTSATKTKLPIHRSPSVVRVFTIDDFNRFGFKTLKDLMVAVPGIQLVHSYKNHTNLWVRGIQTRYNSKLLLLIDGVPIRENYHGHFNIDQGMTLDNIERVEVINGPGAVLYGANAFAGVISVFTKSSGRSVSLDLAAQESYGYNSATPESDNEEAHDKQNYSKKITLEADTDIGEDNHLYGLVQLASGEPFNPERGNDGGERYEHDLTEEKRYIMGKFQRDSFTLTASDNKTDVPDSYNEAFKETQQIHHVQYLALNYQNSINGSDTLNGNVWYENYRYSKDKTTYLDDGSGNLDSNKQEFIYSSMVGMDVDYSWIAASVHQLTLGISFLHDESIDRLKERENDGGQWEPWEFNLAEDVSRDTTGIFIQDNWKFTDDLSLTTSIRKDFLSDFEDQFSYRLGLTAEKSIYYGKILLGSAYRTPNYREYLKVGVENKAIEPEEVMTAELQIGGLYSQGDVSLTYYYNEYTNFIKSTLVPEEGANNCDDRDQFFSNFDVRKIMGLEFYASYYPTQNLSLKFTASRILRATEKNGKPPSEVLEKVGSCEILDYKSDEQDILLLSKTMLSVLTAYRFDQRYSVGLNIQYASKRDTPENFQTNIPDYILQSTNADPKAYFLLDLYGGANITADFSINAGIRNVLDQKVFYPRLSKIEDYGVELPRRRYELGLKYEF
ncbi:MAG: TonB-dependent receptor [Pseudomonadales bacterium]|nr:TonB-dependent receptor [Pseudomonadales bacterium]